MKQLIKKLGEIILDRAKGYYENNKEVLREKTRVRYRKLSDETKNIKREYGRIDIKICRKKTK